MWTSSFASFNVTVCTQCVFHGYWGQLLGSWRWIDSLFAIEWHLQLWRLLFVCSGGDAGSCLEAGRPEYGIFHSPGVVERHGLTAVRHSPNPSPKLLSCGLVVFKPPFSRVIACGEMSSMSNASLCCCQVRLHGEAEELTRLPAICFERQHQF